MTNFLNDEKNPKMKVHPIVFPDFVASCAGISPWSPGYWFGSDDGRIRFLGADGRAEVGPFDVSPSGEAVNGMAFIEDLMAVTTRSDVIFLSVPHPHEGKKVESAAFYGGSHGVAATENGRFVAAMGIGGILSFGPEPDNDRKVRLTRAVDEAAYIYKIVGAGSSGRGDVIGCAARKGGFLVLNIGPDGEFNLGKRFRAPGVDIVDVCSLNSSAHPRAAAALGLDRSIHFTQDALLDPGPKTLRIPDIRGRAYRLFEAAGHLFMLTSKGIYLFPDLVSRLLDGGPFDEQIRIRSNWLEIEAVDASPANDKVLLVMPKGVYEVEISNFVANGASGNRRTPPPMDDGNSHTDHASFVANENVWEPFEDREWSQSEERVLRPVA